MGEARRRAKAAMLLVLLPEPDAKHADACGLDPGGSFSSAPQYLASGKLPISPPPPPPTTASPSPSMSSPSIEPESDPPRPARMSPTSTSPLYPPFRTRRRPASPTCGRASPDRPAAGLSATRARPTSILRRADGRTWVLVCVELEAGDPRRADCRARRRADPAGA